MTEKNDTESRFVLKCISTVFKSVWTKYGKYRVEMGVVGEKKAVYWLTEKQREKLDKCFDLTPKGWSGKRAAVYGVFEIREDGKDRFCWCGVETKHHSDVPWLEEKFGVKKEYGYVIKRGRRVAAPELDVPGNVEVDDELAED